MEGRKQAVEDYYRSMSNLCSFAVDEFLWRVVDDNDNLMKCAERNIRGNNWSMISFSTVAKRLYEWLKNEYDNCPEPRYRDAYASSNFIAVMNKILSLELLLIQYDMCTRPRDVSLTERDFFISYANNYIIMHYSRRGFRCRELVLYPVDLFEEVYNKIQDVTKDIPLDKLEDYYKKYTEDKTVIHFH